MSKEIDEALERLYANVDTDADYYFVEASEDYNTIKNYILKSQKTEEILQKYYQDGITLDSVRALKQERDNYKKVLKIIKEKCVNVWHLMKSKTVEEYNSYLYVEDIEDTKIFILTQEEFDMLKECFR